MKATRPAHNPVAIERTPTLRYLSANQAKGIVERTRTTPPKLPNPKSIVSEIFNVSWMSGPSTVIATRSNSSTIDRRSRTRAIETPPFSTPSLKDISSSPTPGSRSSGKMVSAVASSKAAFRASSSSRMAAEMLAASFEVDASSTVPPLMICLQLFIRERSRNSGISHLWGSSKLLFC